MKHSNKIIFYLFLFLLSPTINYAQNNSRSKMLKHNRSEEKIKLLEDQLAAWQKDLNVPNVGLGIIQDGKLIHAKVYGKDSTGSLKPVNTLFNVASVTKVVFSTLVLKLIDNGDWQLDEPLYHYYTDPDIASDSLSKKLTTRHILSHQSGFSNWRWMNASGKLQFEFAPGTKFNYSGEGMEYLKKAIEHKFHKSLVQLSDSILFKPFGMIDTKHEWDGKQDLKRFSRWYDANGKEYTKSNYASEPSAADDLITTVIDLSKFGIETLNGLHISKQLFNKIIKGQAKINQNLMQGLGWRLIKDLPNHEYAMEHGGNDAGVAAIIVLLPKSKRGIIVLTNGDNGQIICNNIVRSFWPEGTEIIHKALKSTPLNDIHKVFNISDDILNTYTGKYMRPDGEVVNIYKKDKNLILKTIGLPTFNLFPQTQEIFFLWDFDPKIIFTKNEKGIVDTLLIKDGDNILKCTKMDK
ncbi:CubicO group peptidase (beta-lactamase class C family) [Pedobacter alluvionis]|uniref:CubicO group peptidase (Beta-lactamase class C family) n=2 Tax=Pedobacter alluvionis TaxID=475253 RepID=A0A497XXW2_9SPHI|nr:CubicO group peptidase (beta-lactamase class C family) [Pedobacter alluvionis]TFB28920.1 serine hydrolase [Pedobacter alluvionis]